VHTSGGIGRNKKTRKLETTPGARFVTDIKKDIFKLIKNGLEAKYSKRYDKVYMLVLFFEDHQVFKNDKDQQELRNFVKNDLPPLSSTFEVGRSRHLGRQIKIVVGNLLGKSLQRIL